jgi:hypothetical protein
MKTTKSALCLLGLSLLASGFSAFGQDVYRECQSKVSARANVPVSDVSTDDGPWLQDGNVVVNWRLSGSNMTGYCIANPHNGQVLDMQRGAYQGPTGNLSNGGSGDSVPRWMVGSFSGYNRGSAVSLDISPDGQVNAHVNGTTMNGQVRDQMLDMGSAKFYLDREDNGFSTRQVGHEDNRVHYTRASGNDSWNNGNWNSNNSSASWNKNVSYPHVSVDTGGHGTWNGPDQTARITRGSIDTNAQPTVSLSGDNHFKITCRGEIVSQNGKREFTMNIAGCDRGDARGTASFRLNGDKNEVEWISISGNANSGASFSGTFNR